MNRLVQELAASGKYDNNKILLIGDAPADPKAAQSKKVLFYPVIPGTEKQSWRDFRNEELDRFFAGTFAGPYQEKLLMDFDAALPSRAPWQS